MDWKKLVSAIAPTIGTALGGPLGTWATKAVMDKLGVDSESAIEKTLRENPDAGLKLVEAENEFKLSLGRMNIDLEKVHADDRASARHMQETNKSAVPGVISYALHILLAALLGLLAWHPIPPENKDAFMYALGMVSTGVVTCWGFWFGSAFSSQAKDATIARAVPKAA